MLKYMVFAGDYYYPQGPEDFRKAFHTIDQAVEYKNSLLVKGSRGSRAYDWASVWVFDNKTGAFDQVSS